MIINITDPESISLANDLTLTNIASGGLSSSVAAGVRHQNGTGTGALASAGLVKSGVDAGLKAGGGSKDSPAAAASSNSAANPRTAATSYAAAVESQRNNDGIDMLVHDGSGAAGDSSAAAAEQDDDDSDERMSEDVDM